MSALKLCLFSSTPEMEELGFLVKVLTGTPEELAQRAVDWGYDGIEFLPDAERVPEPEAMAGPLRRAGAVMTVVNSGRIAAQGMGLLHENPAIRRRSIEAFQAMVDLAAPFKARVGLGMARGPVSLEADLGEVERIADTDRRKVGGNEQSVAASGFNGELVLQRIRTFQHEVHNAAVLIAKGIGNAGR
ncbi:MAG: hypothetical protein CL878_01110, partial [Dehalococcoidia bacterium]|nr:hypothetical protein [Dehalococcoidia bacterium]